MTEKGAKRCHRYGCRKQALRKFCSDACRIAHHNSQRPPADKVKVTCQGCGKVFQGRPDQKCHRLAEIMRGKPGGMDPAIYADIIGYDAALVRSVHRNNLFEVLTLLEGRASPDAHWLEEGKRDHTALGTAAHDGFVEAVRLLLAALAPKFQR